MSEQPKGETLFEDLGLHPNLLKGIHALGFLRPTPIQAQAIPHILAGRDVIGSAQTGTGKTAAFVLPILHRLMEGKSGKNVRALIITPTRELALQVMEHLKALSRYVHLKGTAIFGGTPMQPQISALAAGVDILSATPGRLLDHIYSGRIDFVDLQVLVLDEADRMLDMGFLPDIQKILRLLPPREQRLMFSATMPSEILRLAHQILHEPVTVQVGRVSSAAVGIRHAVYPVPSHLKTELLMQLLRGDGMDSVLVFARTKRSADHLARQLDRSGIKCGLIHGDRTQGERLSALQHFRQGSVRVMVATDIAARGIDIEDITHVINFDVPDQPEDYIHRIGRTARAQAEGDAFTLMDRREEPLMKNIERALGRSIPRVTLPGFNYKKAGGQGQGSHGPRQRSRFGSPRHAGRRNLGGSHDQPGGRPERRRHPR
ncbi:MAG: DEAD/DEAH box helicase [Candidatus Omnitrophica bacterium]|nr:DEAD/DEAH box helicase [Candidatus Omnitrophota bacterium]